MNRAIVTFYFTAAVAAELLAVYDRPQGEGLSASSWAVDIFAASALPVP